MKVLVTGGLGYIGSNTVAMLLERGHQVHIIDDFSNVSKKNLESLKYLIEPSKIISYRLGLAYDKYFLADHFGNTKFDAIIHFAGKKAVGESVQNPHLYYDWNINSTLEVIQIAKMVECNRLIFSSSASVYGNAKDAFCRENVTKELPTNPYAASKLMCERIIRDAIPNSVSLRYFNPIGAGSARSS